MSELCYTVPDEVLFRNFEVLSQHSAQTRNLLLQNKTQEPLQAYLSHPFTQHFGLRLSPGDGSQRLVSTPPHVAATVRPGTPCKFTVELLPPDDDTLNYVHDMIIVVMGSRVMLVPVRAVRQSLDPFGGAQLAALIKEMPFWPTLDELRAHAEAYLLALNKHYGLSLQLPDEDEFPALQLQGQAEPTAKISDARATSRDASPAAVGSAIADSLQPPKQDQGVSLPPDSFSAAMLREAVNGGVQASGATGDDDDEPIVIHRAVVKSGREAVAAAAAASTSGRGKAKPSNVAPPLGSPAGHAKAQASGPPLPTNNVAFRFDDGCFDSRGWDVTQTVASATHEWVVVDCFGDQGSGVGVPTASKPSPSAAMRMATPNGSLPFSSRPGTNGPGSAAMPSPTLAKGGSAGGSGGAAGGDSLRAAALQAAMAELGMTDLPPPSVVSRPSSSASSGPAPGRPSLPPPDMRLLRPRSGTFSPAKLPGGSQLCRMGSCLQSAADGDADLEEDMEARLQRNIDLSMPLSSSGSRADGHVPGAGGLRGGALMPLAPLPSRTTSGSAGGRPGSGPQRQGSCSTITQNNASQLGYGDDGTTGDALERQIDSQLGRKAAVAAGPKGSPSTSGSAMQRANSGPKPGSSDTLVAAARRGVPNVSPGTARTGLAPAAPARARDTLASPARVTGPSQAPATVNAPMMPHKSPSKPSPKQLKAQQAAWDAL